MDFRDHTDLLNPHLMPPALAQPRDHIAWVRASSASASGAHLSLQSTPNRRGEEQLVAMHRRGENLSQCHRAVSAQVSYNRGSSLAQGELQSGGKAWGLCGGALRPVTWMGLTCTSCRNR